MTFNRIYLLEATAYPNPHDDDNPLFSARFVGNDTGVRVDARTADRILTAASDKGFEVRFMPDWDSVGQDKQRTKTLVEREFQAALRRKNMIPGWIDIVFKAMVYVPLKRKS